MYDNINHFVRTQIDEIFDLIENANVAVENDERISSTYMFDTAQTKAFLLFNIATTIADIDIDYECIEKLERLTSVLLDHNLYHMTGQIDFNTINYKPCFTR